MTREHPPARRRSTIEAVIERGRESGYVAQTKGLGVVTQGATLDETVANLLKAIALFLDDGDHVRYGLSRRLRVRVSLELELDEEPSSSTESKVAGRRRRPARRPHPPGPKRQPR